MLASARVILVARQERMADYKAALAKVNFCVVESYSDIYTALLAIGTRLPAAVVIEAETSDASRLAMLESLRADPSVGSTEILVVGRSAATRRSGGSGPGSRTTVFVDELPALPAAIEALSRPPPHTPFRSRRRLPFPSRTMRASGFSHSNALASSTRRLKIHSIA